MDHRRDEEMDVIAGQLVSVDGNVDVEQQVGVGDHRALGLSGGARCVHDEDQVVGLNVRIGIGAAFMPGEFGERNDALRVHLDADRRRRPLQSFQRRPELFVGEKEAGVDVFRHGQHVARQEPRVDGHDHDSASNRRPVSEIELDAIGHGDGEERAAAEAEAFGIGGGDAPGGLVQLAIGGIAAGVTGAGPVAQALRHALPDLGYGLEGA